MKTIVSVGGRFHAFNLAAELAKQGHLERLITSYPAFEVAKYGIPRGSICSMPAKEVLERAWGRLPRFLRVAWNPQFFFAEFFDERAARRVVPADIFVGWSSFSLHTLRKARTLGARIIVERGSSHIVYQRDLMRDEYERWGVAPTSLQLPHPAVVEKELKEYEEADAVAVPSLFVKRTFLEKKIPERKIIHIPYGVDLSSFRRIPRSDTKFRAIYTGGMSFRKGTPYLLQAWSELRLPDAELVLIGSMSDEVRPFFRKYAGTFTYLGHVHQSELYRHYSNASVFVMPSIEEGLALVQLQAMACGLPILATTNTGAEDVVRDGTDGFIVPIRDTEALKKKLTYLYENREICAKMGESAAARVSQSFTWDDYGAKIVVAYQRLLDGLSVRN